MAEPVVVEIHVRTPSGEITIKHTQRMDEDLGWPIEPNDAPMKRATADAASWLRRNGKEPRR